MKLLCESCNNFMDYQKHDSGEEEGSLNIRFSCPECKNNVALITNAGETEMVSSFGVKLGGETSSAPPLETTMGALKGEPGEGLSLGDPEWTPEAEERLNNVPPFVRPMARKGIERIAKEKGYREITVAVMDEAREIIGH